MASDSISSRRIAWSEHLALLEPQIRGLEDKVEDAVSEELRAYLRDRLEYLYTRRRLVQESITAQDEADAAMSAAEAHGFPVLNPVELPAALKAELDREGADDAAARSGFVAEDQPQASVVTINLGAAQDIP